MTFRSSAHLGQRGKQSWRERRPVLIQFMIDEERLRGRGGWMDNWLVDDLVTKRAHQQESPLII